MDEDLKSKIKPYYEELQGYLSQTPLPKEQSEICTDDEPWGNWGRGKLGTYIKLLKLHSFFIVGRVQRR